MNRREFFIRSASSLAGSLAVFTAGLRRRRAISTAEALEQAESGAAGRREIAADLVVLGGCLGGMAAALAAARAGLKVIVTEETDWIGGQLTQQGVPPDEHPWIESFGATHLTNGCYRLHPVEWNIGEAAGLLAAFALEKKEPPRRVRGQPALLRDFQERLRSQGVELDWPRLTPR
ncbi:MAG: FAD-dependent oxidoreductase [Planctomycetes bacterium]|nr:FAD-dependent oxidoreductase [Planctomycetota bacterium]